MARITVEDCLTSVESRFELVILAARRAKMLMKGAKPLVETDNRPIVSALREVAAGKVRFLSPEEKRKMLESLPPPPSEGPPPAPEDVPAER